MRATIYKHSDVPNIFWKVGEKDSATYLQGGVHHSENAVKCNGKY